MMFVVFPLATCWCHIFIISWATTTGCISFSLVNRRIEKKFLIKMMGLADKFDARPSPLDEMELQE
jgi:hypothetical protein